jgi:hypothetical protein
MQAKKRKRSEMRKSNPAGSPNPGDVQSLIDSDPLLQLIGSGRDLWADEHADEYVRRIREGWEERTAWEIVEDKAKGRDAAKYTVPSEPRVPQDDRKR